MKGIFTSCFLEVKEYISLDHVRPCFASPGWSGDLLKVPDWIFFSPGTYERNTPEKKIFVPVCGVNKEK